MFSEFTAFASCLYQFVFFDWRNLELALEAIVFVPMEDFSIPRKHFSPFIGIRGTMISTSRAILLEHTTNFDRNGR